MSAAPIPYLGAEAAALGDRELASPRVRRPTPHITDSMLAELEYAADLCQRASQAVGDSLARLAGAGVNLGHHGAQSVSMDLMGIAVLAHIAVLRSKEAQKNGL